MGIETSFSPTTIIEAINATGYLEHSQITSFASRFGLRDSVADPKVGVAKKKASISEDLIDLGPSGNSKVKEIIEYILRERQRFNAKRLWETTDFSEEFPELITALDQDGYHIEGITLVPNLVQRDMKETSIATFDELVVQLDRTDWLLSDGLLKAQSYAISIGATELHRFCTSELDGYDIARSEKLPKYRWAKADWFGLGGLAISIRPDEERHVLIPVKPSLRMLERSIPSGLVFGYDEITSQRNSLGSSSEIVIATYAVVPTTTLKEILDDIRHRAKALLYATRGDYHIPQPETIEVSNKDTNDPTLLMATISNLRLKIPKKLAIQKLNTLIQIGVRLAEELQVAPYNYWNPITPALSTKHGQWEDACYRTLLMIFDHDMTWDLREARQQFSNDQGDVEDADQYRIVINQLAWLEACRTVHVEIADDMTISSDPAELSVYLDQFRSDNPIYGNCGFIMMRFANTPIHNQITRVIKETLKRHNLIGLRADDRTYSDDLFPNIRTYMHGCAFGIAVFERVMTEDFNPNISLEAGYMMALNKQVCLLKDSTLRGLQTDLVGRLYRDFDFQRIEDSLTSQLESWLRDKPIIA